MNLRCEEIQLSRLGHRSRTTTAISILVAVLFVMILYGKNERLLFSYDKSSKAVIHSKNSTSIEVPQWDAKPSLNSSDSVEGTASQTQSPPFRPLELFKEYTMQHSDDILRKEDEISTSFRKFSVAYYSCPQRAGNMLHTFINTVVWSMIHNRTLLWIYQNTSNQEEDCQSVLQRASWIPSYYEWKTELNLSDPVPVSNKVGTFKDQQQHQVVLYPQIPDILAADHSITRNAWSDHPLDKYRDYLQHTPEMYQERVLGLYSEGAGFLFGMLYDKIFHLVQSAESVVVSAENSELDEQDVFSVALHSRHTVAADDGSYVMQELKCLKKLLASHQNRCQVYIMSDRPKTISLLTDWLNHHEQNCLVVTADHASQNGPVKEHGPWAGVGFLEDLDVAAHARNGIIGDPHRSSTALLIELMEYRRESAASKSGTGLGALDDMRICKLPNKPIAGYDYGPGTPTFRHHSYLKPLSPVKALDNYLQNSEYEQNVTVAVSIDLCRPTQQDVYYVLNSFIFAIVNDMSVRWDLNSDQCCSCDGNGSLFVREAQSRYEWDDDLFKKRTELQLESSLVDMDSILDSLFKSNPQDVVSVRSNKLHYNTSDWKCTPEESAKGACERLRDLFSEGPDVLYGMLFDEVFSHCPSSPIHENIAASQNTVVLQLNGNENISQPDQDRMRQCLSSVFNATQIDDENGKGFHLTILSESSSIDESILGVSLSDHSNGIGDQENEITCTYSLYPFEESTVDYRLLDRSFWRKVEEVSEARGAWVGPQSKVISEDVGMGSLLDTAATFARERLQYRRYWETWKMGREPFAIEPFTECLY